MPKFDPTPETPLTFYRVGTVHPSPPDPRDHVMPLRLPAALPAEYVQPQPPVRNQGAWGACGAFGAICALEYEYAKAGQSFDGSEQFQYAETRRLQNNSPCEDFGSYPREAMRVLTEIGAVTESRMPYQSEGLCWRPNDLLRNEASSRRAVEYFKPQPFRDAVKAALYGTTGHDGHVLAYCCLVYQNFEPDASGTLPAPSGSVMGGHWMELVGWSEQRQAYRVRNQWGAGWGDGGYCWIRYRDAELPSDRGGMWIEDAWAVRTALQPPPPPEPQPEPFGPPPPPDTAERYWFDRGFNYCYCKHVDPDNAGCR